MKINFVNYTEALSLKELGFDEKCLAYYNKKELFSFSQTCNEKLKGHYIKMSNRLCTPLYQQAIFFLLAYLDNKYSKKGLYSVELLSDGSGSIKKNEKDIINCESSQDMIKDLITLCEK